MTDIVERLYAWPAVEKHSDCFSSQHIGALMEEAAREIERLQDMCIDREEFIAQHNLWREFSQWTADGCPEENAAYEADRWMKASQP